MSRGSKGPIIQIDRLIFDTRDKTKRNSFIQDPSSSPTMLNYPINKEISKESYVSLPSDKLKVIRLTFDDLKNENIYSDKDEEKIYAMGQQSSKILEKTIKQNDEIIRSPVYESIDGRRDSTYLH